MLYEELHDSLQLAETLLADVQRLHPRTGLVPYGRSSLQSITTSELQSASPRVNSPQASIVESDLSEPGGL